MTNLLEEVSTLTTIQHKQLESLLEIVVCCISNAVKENRMKGIEVTDINVGLGTLSIKDEGENLKYKFTPHSELTNCIIKEFSNNSDLLEKKLELKLVDGLMEVKKNLIW